MHRTATAAQRAAATAASRSAGAAATTTCSRNAAASSSSSSSSCSSSSSMPLLRLRSAAAATTHAAGAAAVPASSSSSALSASAAARRLLLLRRGLAGGKGPSPSSSSSSSSSAASGSSSSSSSSSSAAAASSSSSSSASAAGRRSQPRLGGQAPRQVRQAAPEGSVGGGGSSGSSSNGARGGGGKQGAAASSSASSSGQGQQAGQQQAASQWKVHKAKVPGSGGAAGGKGGPQQQAEFDPLGVSSVARGPVSWGSLGVTLVFGSALLGLFWGIKAEKDARYEAQKSKHTGKARIGGPFALIDHHGQPMTSAHLKGKHVLVYFGFVNCPDICPAEMKRMSAVVDAVNALEAEGLAGELVPLFVTVDPNRDSVAEVAEYVADFNPAIVGATGAPEQIDALCKKFRVYNHRASELSEDDYLIDHSIILYLMDRNFEFVDFFSTTDSEDAVKERVIDYLRQARDADGPPPKASPWDYLSVAATGLTRQILALTGGGGAGEDGDRKQQ